jgi:glutamate formiminotransferase
MATCVGLAQAVGRRIADELGVPVYLYGEAAMRPERRLLANVRRGGYEGLREEVGVDPSRAPDFGPALLGPAGACAVGARNLLIAFNVHLHAEVGAAQEIARRVRESSGGLPSVQALGLAIRPGISQVSTNLMEPSVTPLHVVAERIRVEAERLGVKVGVSELVGLLPEEAVMDAAADALGLPSLRRGQVIELAAEQAFLASS